MATQVELLTGLVNVAIPEVYQKGMSYYEVLTAVVNKVNDLIKQSNEYFSEDVQSVMTKILIGWKDDGTLSALIADAVLDIGVRQYTEQNYVTDGETVTASIDVLDMTLKTANNQFADYGQNIKKLGATGDGLTDDTTAINNAMLTAVDGDVFVFPTGTYLIEREITISKRIKIIGHNAIIKFSMLFDDLTTNTLSAFYVTADEVEITGLIFDGSAKTNEVTNNRFIWVHGDDVNIHNCCFKNLAGGGYNFNGAIGFSNQAQGGNVSNCYFNDCPGAVFTKAPRTRISNCTTTSPRDVSFALNGPSCIGSSVIGCKIYSYDNQTSIHIGVEESASDYTISNNYIYGVKNGAGISCVTVAYVEISDGGIISNNIIDGGGFTVSNPTVLLNIGPNYKNVIISNNIIKNGAIGNSSNAMVSISSNDNVFANNKVIMSGNETGFCVYVALIGGELELSNNKINGTGSGSIIRFNTGDNNNYPIRSKGNIYQNANEGIRLLGGVNVKLYCENDNFIDVTSPINGTDWQNFFNVDKGYRYPHSIKEKIVMYGGSMPTSGSWELGDVIYNTKIVQTGTAGSRYLVYGWKRINTGSNNVLGTDWFELRILTGN